MKTKRKLLILTILIIGLASKKTFAQWSANGDAVTSITYLGTTTQWDLPFLVYNGERARIKTTGEFGLGTTTPGAWLHILTNGSGTALSKNAFTTDVPDGSDTYWRMQKNGTDYARLLSFTGGNAFYIHAPKGHLRFASGTGGNATGAMEIREQGGADAGYVGIGTYGGSFSPSCRLHLHEVAASTSIAFQISNNSTGYSATDGLRILNDNSGRVTLYNWEDDDIAFGTGNSGGGGSLNERLVISSGLNYGRVGVGTNSPAAQLDVYDNTDITISGDDVAIRGDEILSTSNTVNRSIGAYIQAANGTETIGISSVVDNTSSNSNIDMTAIYTRCRNTNASNVLNSYNIYAQNDGVCTSANKFGIASFMTGGSITNSYGGYFSSLTTGTNNYGIRATASGGGTLNYAVHATTVQGGCTTGGPCTDAAGYFDGDVFVTNGTYLTSDAMFKTNVQPVSSVKNILGSCNVKTFDYNQSQFGNINLPVGNHFGLIAQEVENILPNLVKTAIAPDVRDSLNNVIFPEFSFKAVNYVEFIPILIQGFKEQQQTIDSLIQVISLQNPTPLPNINPQNSQKISLSNVSSIILNQNDPNPFTESTRITFQIPDEVRDAKIIFISTTGTIINTAIINERGAGELEVYSSELSKGLYNYTLVCDGKVIATKKMVKQ